MSVSGYFERTGDNKEADTTVRKTWAPDHRPKAEKSLMDRNQRGLNGGALVLPALYGGGEMAHQIMLLLSVADDFGGAGKYS